MNAVAGPALLVMVLGGCAEGDSAAPGSGAGDGAAESGTSAPAKPSGSGQHDGPAHDPNDPVEQRPSSSGPIEDKPNVGKPSAGSTALPKDQINAKELPKSHPRQAAVKGSTLSITAQESGCEKASAELAKQSASQVVVTLVVTEPKEPRMCTMDVRFPSLTVELDEPLGKRTLVLKQEKRKR